MMCSELPVDPDAESLLSDAAAGDSVALGKLLDRYRARLRRMVAIRLDSRVTPHLDATDIVQEALADAVQKLPEYNRRRPLPFYPWLHRLTAERLAQANRRHRRGPGIVPLPDSSADRLLDRLVAADPSPGQAVINAEQRQRVRAALDRLASSDREILLMRHLEDLRFAEIAAILGVAEGAVKMRHLRALRRITALVEGDGSEPRP